MVRPRSFGFNEQTAATNSFQHHVALSSKRIQQQADNEFMAMVDSLRQHKIRVIVFEDSDSTPPKPDAVFSNNWLSTWPDGTIYLYPMATESRRTERNFAALDLLNQQFAVRTVSDISATEQYGVYLESTGAIVFDHSNKLAYGCISDRCDQSLFISHVLQRGYQPVPFHAYDPKGKAVYHTNVLMGITTHAAVICAEAITDQSERAQVLSMLKRSGREILAISAEQTAAFCGNVLELRSAANESFLAMSQTAFDAFTPRQRQILTHNAKPLPFRIPTIETIGGGSARCMLTEVFLPRKLRPPLA